MADTVANIGKGKAAYYGTLPLANDALIIVLLKTAQADTTLEDYADLGALLGNAGNVEANFTNYARKTATNVTVTVDNTNERVDVDMDDITWSSAGGGTNNTLAKLLVCYDNDTTGGTDANIIPLTLQDFVVTTDGTDLTAQVAVGGFFRAS